MRSMLLWVVLVAGIAALPLPNSVEARPGGGHSSSGHHSSSSSRSSHSSSSSFSHSSHSSSSGTASEMSDGEIVLFIGIAIILLLLWGVYTVYSFLARLITGALSITSKITDRDRVKRQAQVKRQLAQLKQSDPNFSCILFLDFIHSLYNKFYSYSTKAEFSYLTPFLSADLQRHFQKAGPSWTMSEVVINGIQWQEINIQHPEKETIALVIDANYTREQQNKRTRYTVTERWRLERNKGLLSPEPDKMQALCCPNCGAPAHFTDAGQCDNCGSIIQQGEKQWFLAKRAVLQTSALEADSIVSYAVEQGTQLPTVKQDDFSEQKQRFAALHDLSDWQQFWPSFRDDVIKTYFITIYEQWSLRNWHGVRHLLSDRLYEANLFWQLMYSEQNWFNRLDNLRIEQIEPVKIDIDRFYEAITVRIFASCHDYTEDASGKVLGGSKRSRRRYSEYWTFVRRIGLEQTHAPYSINQCPQCGAPADNFGQTSICGYCGAKVSTGEFSWVLFLIMQDDVYDG